MSFIIKCGKCGREGKFEDKRYEGDIEIGLTEKSSWAGAGITVESIDISCSFECGNEINI